MSEQLIKALATIQVQVKSPLSLADSGVEVVVFNDKQARALALEACGEQARKLARDANNRPYIPAASIKGALRQWVADAGLDADNIARLLGHSFSANKVELQTGSCRIYSAFSSEGTQTITLTQNSIDEITGAGKDNQLFSREYLCTGSLLNFEIQAEFVDKSLWLAFLGLLHGQTLQLGAGSNNDFGLVQLTVTQNKGINASQLSQWLSSDNNLQDSLCDLGIDWQTQNLKAKGLQLTFTITSPDPILIADPLKLAALEKRYKADKNLKPKDNYMRLDDQGQPYLPATSIRGALRGQYRRIVRTLLLQHSQDTDWVEQQLETFCQVLWGDTQHKAGLKITDAIHSGQAQVHQQTAIAIDRFTGGAANGAMLELEASLAQQFTITLSLSPRLLGPEYAPQRTVLLLLIRDMYEQDISIGAHKSKGFGRLEFCLQEANGEKIQSSEHGFNQQVLAQLLAMFDLKLEHIDSHLATLHTITDKESAHV